MPKRAASVASLDEPAAKRANQTTMSAEDAALVKKYTDEQWLPKFDPEHYSVTEHDLEQVRKFDAMLRKYDACRANDYKFVEETAPPHDPTIKPTWVDLLDPEKTVLVSHAITGKRAGTKLRVVPRAVYEKTVAKKAFGEKAPPYKVELPAMILPSPPGETRLSCSDTDYKADLLESFHQWKRSLGIPVGTSIPATPLEFLYGCTETRELPDGTSVKIARTPKRWAYTMRLRSHAATQGLKLLYERCMHNFFKKAEIEEMNFATYLSTKKMYGPVKSHGDALDRTSIFAGFNGYEPMDIQEMCQRIGEVTAAELKKHGALPVRKRMVAIAMDRNPSSSAPACDTMKDADTRDNIMRDNGLRPVEFDVMRRGKTGWTSTKLPLEPHAPCVITVHGIPYSYTAGQTGMHYNLGGARTKIGLPILQMCSPAPSSMSQAGADVTAEDAEYESDLVAAAEHAAAVRRAEAAKIAEAEKIAGEELQTEASQDAENEQQTEVAQITQELLDDDDDFDM